MSGSGKNKELPREKPISKASKARIFIVEDEIVIVRGLEDALERLGYQACGFALSGEEALAALAGAKPDLVLVDIYLKRAMDGTQLAKAILEAHAIPVIYLTAYSNEEVLDRAKATSPYGYIVKPFRERQLKVTIELALARHREELERKRFLDGYRSTNEELKEQLRADRSELETATEKLRQKGVQLDQLRQEVHEVNRALLALTSHMARTREESEMEVAVAVRTKVLPILKQLQADPAFQKYRIEFEMLSLHMHHLAGGLIKIAEAAGALSAMELRVAALIKNGLSNEQIARQLYLSPETVKTHRRNIRKKLGLQNSSQNLATFLQARWLEASRLH